MRAAKVIRYGYGTTVLLALALRGYGYGDHRQL